MTDPLDIVTLAVSLAAVALSLRKHGASRAHKRKEDRAALGRKYARMAMGVGEGSLQKELDAFRIFDTTLDGKRDFDEKQARTFLDLERASK